jgi:hypothetical protein
MVSRTVLSAIGFTIWAAVLVTAAPQAFSHRHNGHFVHDESPAASCSDFHMEFDGHEAVTQSEEKSISKAEAPTLRVAAASNGGLQVQGWDQNSYSVTLCKAARSGSEADTILSQIQLTFSGGELGVSGPASHEVWSAHLLIKAPRAAAMDLSVHNGPLGLFQVEGNLKVHALNGPITVSGCKGELDVTAQNGPVSLEENSGKLNVRAQNGPITIALNGTAWDGAGLEVQAHNGPVTLHVPSGYQSGVVLESDGHGPFSCPPSVCSEGQKTWDDEHKRVAFGHGPTMVHVSTGNGPVSVI